MVPHRPPPPTAPELWMWASLMQLLAALMVGVVAILPKLP